MGLRRWLTRMPRLQRDPVLPQLWRDVASEHLWHWHVLDDAERSRLEERAFRLLDKHWEAARGFTIDDTMRCIIAAHAAILVLGHDDDLYRNVTAVVVHRSTIMLRGQRRGPSPWVMTNAPQAVHGHTSARGPVFIAWNEVQRARRRPHRGMNVILHEFAHKIDASSGMLDGTPPLADSDKLEQWVDVCTAELEALRQQKGIPVLRSYAGKNPSEFFAVTTEAFFEQPLELRDASPRLYDLLHDFYRQDTAARESRAAESVPEP